MWHNASFRALLGVISLSVAFSLMPISGVHGQCATTWSDQFLGHTGLNSYPSMLISYDPDGPSGFDLPLLIAAGSFTSADSMLAYGWAAFNGTHWRPIAGP